MTRIQEKIERFRPLVSTTVGDVGIVPAGTFGDDTRLCFFSTQPDRKTVLRVGRVTKGLELIERARTEASCWLYIEKSGIVEE